MAHSHAMLAPTQHELLSAAVSGDRSALEAVARAWWPEVRRWCLLDLGDPVLADDASQDALLRLVRFIGQYDPDRPFRPWLRHLARNACRDLRSRSARQADRDGPLGDIEDVRDGERVLDLNRASRLALDAFRALTPRQREVVDLCDRQGLNSSEVSENLGIESSTVRVLLHQARRALRTHLLATSPDMADLVRES